MLNALFGQSTKLPGQIAPCNRMLNIVEKLKAQLAYRGPKGMGLKLFREVYRKLNKSFTYEDKPIQINGPDSINYLSRIDHQGVFDPTDIGKDTKLAKSAVRYEATSEVQFHYILSKLDLDYTKYNFIDYGSGKGATLAMAASYPFKEIIGLELSPELHETALNNMNLIRPLLKEQDTNLTVLNTNAGEYLPKEKPSVFFFFNPFGKAVLQSVLNKVEESLPKSDLPSYIIYNNCVHDEIFRASPHFKRSFQPFGGLWAVHKSA